MALSLSNVKQEGDCDDTEDSVIIKQDPDLSKCELEEPSVITEEIEEEAITKFEPEDCSAAVNETKSGDCFESVVKKCEDVLACVYCDKPFSYKPHLTNHILFKHLDKMELHFKCKHCDDSFFSKRLLNEHIQKIHTMVFKCTKCNYSSNCSINLELHVLEKHKTLNKSVMIKCEYCNYKTKFVSDLRDHVKKRHTMTMNDDSLRDKLPLKSAILNNAQMAKNAFNCIYKRTDSESSSFSLKDKLKRRLTDILKKQT